MSEGDVIYLVWNDLVGVSRTRGVPRDQYEQRKVHGLGWAMAGQSLTPFEEIAPNPWGPLSEVRQTPDPETEVTIEGSEGWPALHFVLCDSLEADGSPWECCTRSFMKAALTDLEAETGLTLHTAYENEFLVAGGDRPWSPPFSLASIRQLGPFVERLVATLRAADVGLETVEPEYGVSQYEVSCGPAPGIAGADRVIVTREVLREVARRSGLHASLTPKPAPHAVGNGCHLHLSLWDADGRAAAYDPEGPGELSEVAGQFIAGVVRHLPALTALTAPSPVSYLRLGPHHWSCGYTAVGVQNREAAIRICPSPQRDPRHRGAAFNIEYRPTDATASPYLATGAIVRAGLEGIRAKLPLPPLLDRDPADMAPDERSRMGIEPLPATLDAALDAYEADEIAKGWFTPTMVEAYISLKRHESSMFAKTSPDEMCERYRLAY
ncbi:MAG: glutamine synthetase family protein [Kiloniellales bacterium]